MIMKAFDFVSTGNRWKKYGDNYLKEAREIYSKLNNNIRVISKFLIGFNVTWAQLFYENLTPILKVLSFLSIFTLLPSIFLTIYSDRKSNEFLNIMGRHYENKSDKLLKFVVESQQSAGLSYPSHLWDVDEERVKYDFYPIIDKVAFFLYTTGFILTSLFGAIILLTVK